MKTIFLLLRKPPLQWILVGGASLFLFLTTVKRTFAQDNPQQPSKQTDSLSMQLAYDIKMLQLKMVWPKIVSSASFSEIVELKLFAEEAVKNKDYSLALIYLDEVFSIIRDSGIDSNLYEKRTNEETDTGSAETVFEKEILTGMDFSRQEYHLNFSNSDSAFIETINNPLGGMRLYWNRFVPNRYDFELNAMFKYSRDYSLWQAGSRYEKSDLAGFKIQLEQQGEGMKYSRYFPLQYWQSLSDVSIGRKLSRYLSFHFENEFQYRNYVHETENFSTYRRNEYQIYLRASDFWNSRFMFGYHRDQRRQKNYVLYDYDDRRFDIQHYFNPTWRTSYSAWYQFRQMDYPQSVSDSSFVADYNQHYLSLNFKQNILERLALRLFAEGYKRDYPQHSLYYVDYDYLRAEPGFRFELSEKLTIGVDYLLEMKKYKKSNSKSLVWSFNEDFLGEGVILSVDFFDYKNLIVSFSHTFRLNSYPNAPENSFPGMSLFTDRKQNSTMLFISYQLFSALDINLILQNDLDKDQELQNNDSSSSIFTLDFAWKL